MEENFGHWHYILKLQAGPNCTGIPTLGLLIIILFHLRIAPHDIPDIAQTHVLSLNVQNNQNQNQNQINQYIIMIS